MSVDVSDVAPVLGRDFQPDVKRMDVLVGNDDRASRFLL